MIWLNISSKNLIVSGESLCHQDHFSQKGIYDCAPAGLEYIISKLEIICDVSSQVGAQTPTVSANNNGELKIMRALSPTLKKRGQIIWPAQDHSKYGQTQKTPQQELVSLPKEEMMKETRKKIRW